MSSVADHYKQLLARHYTWMAGVSFDAKVDEQRSLLAQSLQSAKQPPASLAVDLGSGPGFQTIALARLGFSPVIAIDTSAELLDELRTHANNLPIRIEQADLLELPRIVHTATAAVIVCMGDTITHLPARSDVTALFQAVSAALIPGGVFVLTYRDLTTELHGVDRFLPVRSDDHTIMTCFLEYHSPEAVTVHDIIYSRGEAGWTLHKSSYPKLRLPIAWLVQELTAAGLVVESQGPAGRLTQIVAHKR
jgi:SAM-dependent methyltransferase